MDVEEEDDDHVVLVGYNEKYLNKLHLNMSTPTSFVWQKSDYSILFILSHIKSISFGLETGLFLNIE